MEFADFLLILICSSIAVGCIGGVLAILGIFFY